MNILFKDEYLSVVIKALIFALVLKILSTTAVYFLPKHSIDRAVSKGLELPYFALRLDKALEQYEDVIPVVTEESIVEEMLPITELILKALFGSEKHKKQALAIVIKKGSKDAEILSIGDVIEKYKLIEVDFKNKEAIFEANLKKYNLPMDTIKQKKVSITKLSGSSIQNAKRLKEDGGDVILAVPKAEILTYRKNFKEIWKNISIKEELSQGKINGFRVLSIRPNTIFARLGIKPGDVIKAVNNNPLKSYADAFKIYYQVENMRNLKLTILRNKKTKELEYEIY